MTTPGNEQPRAKLDNPEPSRSRVASHFFWATILVLAVATIGLSVSDFIRPNAEPTSIEIKPTILEGLISAAGKIALENVKPKIGAILVDIYAPVYAAIPLYADFHYTVLGQYSEITAAALGQISDGLYKRLFNGFEQRLIHAGSTLDQQYEEAYRSALKKQLGNFQPKGMDLPIGPMTQAALQSAMDRVKITAPLATVAAGVAGSGALKSVTAVMAGKLAVKIAAKAGGKLALKGGGVLLGAGSGALLCSWSGPGAAVCGVIGGLAAWLLTDAAVVNLDEYFNRQDFEAELREIIDEDMAVKKKLFEGALDKNALEVDAAVKNYFNMRDLSSGESEN